MSTARKADPEAAICLHLIKRAFDRAFQAAEEAKRKFPECKITISPCRELSEVEMTSLECLDEAEPFIWCCVMNTAEGDTVCLDHALTVTGMEHAILEVALHCEDIAETLARSKGTHP